VGREGDVRVDEYHDKVLHVIGAVRLFSFFGREWEGRRGAIGFSGAGLWCLVIYPFALVTREDGSVLFGCIASIVIYRRYATSFSIFLRESIVL